MLRPDDSYAVELIRRGALPQLAAGFATEAEANRWIAQDKRLSASAEPFHNSGNRKHRGF